MVENNQKQPYLNFLSTRDIERLHSSSLEILAETGIAVDDEDVRNILAEAGGSVAKDSHIVKLPRSLVETAIERTPSGFTLYGRSEERDDLIVKGNKTYTHTAGGPSYIRDLETGKRRDATLDDIKKAALIADQLDNIHAYSPLVSPTDVVSGAEEVEMVNSAIRNTEKVVENPATSGKEVEFFYRLFAAVTGSEAELKRRPSFLIAVSPISPLTFDGGSAGALLELANKGLPAKILPAPTTGGTAPVTFAGALAQQNAELLGGLTILQTVNPGLPTILGPRLSIMDMRTSYVSWGTQELGRASASAVQLLNSYDIPSDVYGLSSDSKIMDQQQGYEKSMNGVLPGLAGANFLSGAGSLESLKCSSLAQLVIDNEIFGMVLDTIEGFEVTEETIALEVINSVGPEGDFLRERHTAEFSRRGEQYHPAISNRDTWEKWVVKGKKDIGKVAREEAETILSQSSPPNLEPDIRKDLDRITEEARKYFNELK